jgi:hypothetical protein
VPGEPITATATARKKRKMASPDTHPERPHQHTEPQTPTTLERDRGTVARWRKRRAERKRARLVSPRNRRALAASLRRTAKDASCHDRAHRQHNYWVWSCNRCIEQRLMWSPLLHYRAAAVRTELLEIAALLDYARDPDPACVKEIHELLVDGASPLYHPGVHVSELYATLYYIRAGLGRDHASRNAPGPHITTNRGIQPGRPDAIPGEKTNR